ncbi:MAG: helicase C-terminal domain-containing protein [Candidatus Nanoarchaeia archaeon]|nr:helicase C-terminal domain-containing protein [Candidatus Nanoarchaeia archaeon]
MWSLYEDEKELKPLIFSNGKSQADIVKEVLDSVKEGYKIIFIKGQCGTGKSAIALNLARHLGRTSIVVPIKNLQEQYKNDYTNRKYILSNGKKLKISSIAGRKNFKCRFLEENPMLFKPKLKETNSRLNEIFESPSFIKRDIQKNENSCDNNFLPCKIEIKEKNLNILKEYIKQNPDVDFSDFDSIKDIRRMTIAPVCPYWCPIIPEEIELRKFKDSKKITYSGLNNRKFSIYLRTKGCVYYEQYESYNDSDVIIFNSAKYLVESILNRKPATELEVIDECDDFLDNFSNEEQINLNRLLFSINSIYSKNPLIIESINELIDTINAIKSSNQLKDSEGIFELKNTFVEELLQIILNNPGLIDELDEELNYTNHLYKVAKIFEDFIDETFFSISKKENDIIINLVTTNLEKRFKELVEKNKVFVLMSGTIHSENVLKNIFGLEKFKIIEAETDHQGELIPCRYGYELDCSYESFKKGRTTREQYLKSLSKCISCAKKPILVHVNSFSDLPNEREKISLNLENLPTQEQLINEQKNDPFGRRIKDFKDKKSDILFTTKCNRGIDFPGDTCNSIVITRFPYPNISEIFWKILKKNKPFYFMGFYMDKAKRELLQRIYRGLRSKTDKVYLLSPDIRVLDFNFQYVSK